mgnify:CR=1 FL=1
MNNSHSSGCTWQIPAPSALKSGVPVVIGSVLAVPVTDAAQGELVALQVERAFTLPKLPSAVVAAGDKLHWDVAGGRFVLSGTDAGDLENCAVAAEAAGAGVASVVVKLLPGVGTVKSA